MAAGKPATQLPILAAGTHNITATYAGGTNRASGSSRAAIALGQSRGDRGHFCLRSILRWL